MRRRARKGARHECTGADTRSRRGPPTPSAPPHPHALAPVSLLRYTVTVGKKPSKAAYFLDDTQQTEDVLKGLARATLRARTAASDAPAAAAAEPTRAAAAAAAAAAAVPAAPAAAQAPTTPRGSPTGFAAAPPDSAAIAGMLAAGGSTFNLAG